MGVRQYTAADMKKLIEANPTSTFKVVVQACKSGSLDRAAEGQGRDHRDGDRLHEKSYSADPDTAGDPNPADKGSEFTSGLVEDLELIQPVRPLRSAFSCA